jgi:hypothetical protein
VTGADRKFTLATALRRSDDRPAIIMAECHAASAKYRMGGRAALPLLRSTKRLIEVVVWKVSNYASRPAADASITNFFHRSNKQPISFNSPRYLSCVSYDRPWLMSISLSSYYLAIVGDIELNIRK